MRVRKPKAAPRSQRRRRRGRRPESWEGNAPKKALGIYPGFGLRSASAESPPKGPGRPVDHSREEARYAHESAQRGYVPPGRRRSLREA